MESQETIKKICENYENIEKSLVNQLLLETPNHYLTQGTYRENVWKSLFEEIIPKKFCIDQSVFIIDSTGNISREVDLAIFDEQYTPYIFNYGKIKFIPIEAVAVVIQCKSDDLRLEILNDWVKSINKLTTSLSSIVRIMTGLFDNSLEAATELLEKAKANEDEYKKVKDKVQKSQTSTRPIKILCCTNSNKNGIGDKISELFDICISIDSDKRCLRKKILHEDCTYDYWYNELNHSYLNVNENDIEDYNKVKKQGDKKNSKKLSDIKIISENGKENVILSLIFQLNQLLMLINNPMLFPHGAYAKMFNEICSNV